MYFDRKQNYTWKSKYCCRISTEIKRIYGNPNIAVEYRQKSNVYMEIKYCCQISIGIKRIHGNQILMSNMDRNRTYTWKSNIDVISAENKSIHGNPILM